MNRAVALQAFAQGFADGADPAHARKRHQVDAATHVYWHKGFEAGKAAATSAAYAFTRGLVETSSCLCHAAGSGPCPRHGAQCRCAGPNYHPDKPCPVHPKIGRTT